MIIKGGKSLKGEISVPGDKSISHRAIILASISKGKSIISNILMSEDVFRTIDAFRQMGIGILVDEDRKQLIVEGEGLWGLNPSYKDIYCGNSGTTMRLLAGLLSGQNFESKLTGDQALSCRPMRRIVDPLTKMGADIESNYGRAPLIIRPSSLKGIDYKMPIASAQVKSAILLADLYAEGHSRVFEDRISRNHTELMIEHFKKNENNLGDFWVPGDISSAAFFIVLALISEDSYIVIKDVGINPTRTGILDALIKMGGKIEVKNRRRLGNEPIADIYAGYSKLNGIEINEQQMGRIIDELPILAVAASFADGKTHVSGAGELRVKETDRISALVEGLAKFGVDIEEKEDGFIIHDNDNLIPAEVESYNDHRIAMAFSIMAMGINGSSRILNSNSVNISFPEFYRLLSFAE